MNDLKEVVLRTLRPNLIGLVDGFAIPERFITSALATGNPYEVIYYLTFLELLEIGKIMRDKQKNK